MNTDRDLMVALLSYVLTLDHMIRKVNPEEWATHGDWKTLKEQANRAFDAHDPDWRVP